MFLLHVCNSIVTVALMHTLFFHHVPLDILQPTSAVNHLRWSNLTKRQLGPYIDLSPLSLVSLSILLSLSLTFPLFPLFSVDMPLFSVTTPTGKITHTVILQGESLPDPDSLLPHFHHQIALHTSNHFAFSPPRQYY